MQTVALNGNLHVGVVASQRVQQRLGDRQESAAHRFQHASDLSALVDVNKMRQQPQQPQQPQQQQQQVSSTSSWNGDIIYCAKPRHTAHDVICRAHYLGRVQYL